MKILLSIILFIPFLTNGQTDFRAGYIVLNDGQSVSGDIDYRGDLFMGKTCRFRPFGSTEITEYTPYEIQAYRFNDSKYFISKKIDDEQFFLEFLIEGKMNVYYYRDDDLEHYYIEKEGEELIELPYEEELRYENDMRYLYQSKTHIGILTYYTKDAPGFSKKAEKIKKPEPDNLIKIAKDYHYAVCQDEDCTIFEKKMPFLMADLEVPFGMISMTNNTSAKEGIYFQGGILAHLWLPRANEKLYILTGVLFAPATDKNNNPYVSARLLLEFEYMYPRHAKVRPFASISIFSPSYSAGAIAKVYKGLSAGIRGNVHFNSSNNSIIPLVPGTLRSYSIFANILYMF